jgi:transketolase
MNSLQINNRIKLLDLYYSAGCGHIGSSLSCIDIIYSVMSFKMANERMILSKGHAAAALYIVLNHFGEISEEQLKSYYKDGTTLAAHPTADSFINIPFGLGSLGHGFPIGCGIALANKLKRLHDLTFVLMSDGETNEGTTWEAVNFAVRHNLDNLVVFVDKNGLQGFDSLDNVLGDTADPVIWRSIGFDVFETDGHNLETLYDLLISFRKNNSKKPKIVIANTIKGKGVPFMENRLEWHYLQMNAELYDCAISHLRNLLI